MISTHKTEKEAVKASGEGNEVWTFLFSKQAKRVK